MGKPVDVGPSCGFDSLRLFYASGEMYSFSTRFERQMVDRNVERIRGENYKVKAGVLRGNLKAHDTCQASTKRACEGVRAVRSRSDA